MRALRGILIVVSALAGCLAQASVIFEDGFESGTLSPAWVVSGTNQGKVSIRTDLGPATGAGHLVLEDAVADATYSNAYATLSLDLSRKRNVVLSFKAKSLGNEPHDPWMVWPWGANSDGVFISTDGGVNWSPVESLAHVGPSWETHEIVLDQFIGGGILNGIITGDFGPDFRIRFSEYDNLPAPNDGIAIDDVKVTADADQRVMLEMPMMVKEGGGPYTGYALLALPHPEPVTVTFSGPTDQFHLPAAVVVPAGETIVSFEFLVKDDSLVNLTRYVMLEPVAGADFLPMPAAVIIEDDETPPVATISLPERIKEGEFSSYGKITLSSPAAVDVEFSPLWDPDDEMNASFSVIPAGETEGLITLSPYDDNLLDGDVVVTLTARHPAIAPVSGTVLVVDNEIPKLSLEMPATVLEGTAVTVTAKISGPLSTALTVNLNTYQASGLSFPAWVVIPAGQTAVTFELRAINDSWRNLTRPFTLFADGVGASAGRADSVILDDEPGAVLSLSIPGQLREGEYTTGNGRLSLSAPLDIALMLQFSGNREELQFPYSIEIPAGQTEAVFPVNAYDDSRIDGNIITTLIVGGGGINEVRATTTAVDNEIREVRVSLPVSILEGANGEGSVRISGTLTVPLEVRLASGDVASLAVPPSVTIPPGHTYATFPLAGVNNLLRDGTRTVGVTASATGFEGSVETIRVIDNDPAIFRITPATDIVHAGDPVSVTITASDIEGNNINPLSDPVALSWVLADGTEIAATPPAVSLSGANGWSGAVMQPEGASSPLKLRATGITGTHGDSSLIEILRKSNLATNDLVWDGGRSRFYAGVTAGEFAGSVAVVDPDTLAVTASASLGGNPRQIVMTSGGEYLYVSLTGGAIKKIALETMTVISTFTLGVDGTYGAIFAADMCTVAGQPDLLVIAQTNQSYSLGIGIAAYDNGVVRPVKIGRAGASRTLEPSSDPTVFFANAAETSGSGLRRVKLDAEGVSLIDSDPSLVTTGDIRSDGDRVFSPSGAVVDGAAMKRLGAFAVNGLVRPEIAARRVYYLEGSDTYYDKIQSFDAVTFSRIRSLSMPYVSSPGSFIRWGDSGLAFRTPGMIYVLRSQQLIPSDPPADLAVTIDAPTPDSGSAGQPLIYTVTVTNHGTSPAVHPFLNVTFSSNLLIGKLPDSALLSSGPPGYLVLIPVKNLLPGETVSIPITTTPGAAGFFAGEVSVNSNAIDLDLSNNQARKLVNIRFQSAPDSIQSFKLVANNLINDPLRKLLWVTTPATAGLSLSRSLISIDPTNGAVANFIPLEGAPVDNCIALSANGRYLYIGLSDVSEVHRIDLTATPPSYLRIPLGLGVNGLANFAKDIETLDGDGTSFIMLGSGDRAAAVYDGTVRRSVRSSSSTADWIEKSASPGVFTGSLYNSYLYRIQFSTLTVNASGVTARSLSLTAVGDNTSRIHGAGDLVLTGSGNLIDTNAQTVKLRSSTYGIPYLDGPYQRAYLLGNYDLYNYDIASGNLIGRFSLPNPYSWENCVRWGADGFGLMGYGKVEILRWSLAVPAGDDVNQDSVLDSWALDHFGVVDFDRTGDLDQDGVANVFEYLFNTSPSAPTGNPLKIETGPSGLQLVFPRRAGVPPTAYRYEVSTDLKTWVPAEALTESILTTEPLSPLIDTIEAKLAWPVSDRGFIRLRWKP